MPPFSKRPRKQAAKPRKLTADELFEYAVKALAARAHSTGDLRTKLRRRALLTADIEATLERLREIGYLNDVQFAESYAASRANNDGFGRARILMDLRTHNITGSLADQAVETALDGKEETEQIQAYIERRMPSIAAGQQLDDDKKLAAAFRRLRRAGFATSPILKVLKSLSSRADLPEDFPEEEPEE